MRRLSRDKAQNIASHLTMPAIILAADTVVSFKRDEFDKGLILSKPSDEDHARQILQVLRGKAHQIYTGITVLVCGLYPQQITTAVLTTVYMRSFSDDEIEAYISTGSPFDKAGGYAIQDKTFNPVERIEGSYTNVVGLPIETVEEILKYIGYLPSVS